MNYPSFFNDVKPITTFDPLAQFLGAMEDGIIEYTYLEVVKAAGHSCATVAGAYLATAKALKALYSDDLPVRGNISVDFAMNENDGVTGVIGAVVSMITGAKGRGGFKGIAGNFSRNDLLSYGVSGLRGQIKFTRIDTGKSVEIVYTPAVDADFKTGEALGAILKGNATPSEILDFKNKWQNRVKQILIDHYDNENQISIL